MTVVLRNKNFCFNYEFNRHFYRIRKKAGNRAEISVKSRESNMMPLFQVINSVNLRDFFFIC